VGFAMTAMAEILTQHSNRSPSALAASWKGRTLTWSELNERTGDARAQLRQAADSRQIVAVLRADPLSFLALELAALDIGVALLAIPTGAPEAERNRLLAAAGADFFLDFNDARPVLRPRQHAGASRQAANAILLQTSSGSTGTPKIIQRLRENLLSEAHAVAALLRLRRRDTFIHTSPLTHSFTGGLALAAVWAGAANRFIDGVRPAEAIGLCQVSSAPIVTGVPYFFMSLARTQPCRGVRAICGGAPLPLVVARAHNDRFGAPIMQEYGLSEVGIVSINVDHGNTKPLSVGRLCKDISLRVDAAPGVAGELLVARPGASQIYLNANVSSEQTGWIRTGDIGFVDQDGDVFLTGRLKTMINVAGNKVFPEEVAAELGDVEGVGDLRAIGEADEHTGERVVLFVEMSGGLDENTLRRQLNERARQRLTPHKRPSRIVVVERLPRLANGKINQAALMKADTIAGRGNDAGESL
jgi:acyl-CoA synthetase (AMP-forming)/AMP-acid ligase II